MAEYKNPVCRGCYALGTACGKCERCLEAKAAMTAALTTGDEAGLVKEAKHVVSDLAVAGRNDDAKVIYDAHSLAERLDYLVSEIKGLKVSSLALATFANSLAEESAKAAALLRQMAAPGWRPIETAPMDGTHIQIAVLSKDGSFLSDLGWYEAGETREEWDEVEDGVMVRMFEDEEEGRWVSNYCLDALEDPTHWQPRSSAAPSAPTGETE